VASVAAIALLRAAGAGAGWSGRRASFVITCLWRAFEPVDLASRRCDRAAPSRARVEMTQQGRPVLDAMVWSVGDVAGPRTRGHRSAGRSGTRRAPDTRRVVARLAPLGLFVLGQLRTTDARMVRDLAAAGTPPADRGRPGSAPAPPATVRRPLGRRRALTDRARRGELAHAGRARTYTSSRPSSPRASTLRVVPVPGSTSEWILIDAHSPVGPGWAVVVD